METKLDHELARLGYVQDDASVWLLPVGNTGSSVCVSNGAGEAPTDDAAMIGVVEDGEPIGWPADVDADSLSRETRWHAERALDPKWPGARPTTREPAYGAAAQRYSAVHDFGEQVLEILHTERLTTPNITRSARATNARARDVGWLVLDAARSLLREDNGADFESSRGDSPGNAAGTAEGRRIGAASLGLLGSEAPK